MDLIIILNFTILNIYKCTNRIWHGKISTYTQEHAVNDTKHVVHRLHSWQDSASVLQHKHVNGVFGLACESLSPICTSGVGF